MARERIVNALWDAEAGVWVATSDDIRGLVTESKTFEALLKKLRTLVPELSALERSKTTSIHSRYSHHHAKLIHRRALGGSSRRSRILWGRSMLNRSPALITAVCLALSACTAIPLNPSDAAHIHRIALTGFEDSEISFATTRANVIMKCDSALN